MKKQLIKCLIPALIASASLCADELIIMPFHESEGTVAKNLGSLPDGHFKAEGRVKPRVVSPGVGGKGNAVAFTNEQTGRPAHYQSLEIASDAMDHLNAFTLTLWFKSDASQYNTNNPVGSTLKTTLLDTTDGSGKPTPGIKIGLNKGNSGEEQVYVYISDGVNAAQNWLEFKPRFNVRDGEWTFLAITFDASLTKNRLMLYGGDETMVTLPLNKYGFFDQVTGTGDSSSDLISIGDGMNGFRDTSSHLGLIDSIYITDYVMDMEQIEEIRAASVK